MHTDVIFSPYQLHKFLDTGVRGALFANAGYTEPDPTDLALDWIPFHHMQSTLDRILQECAGVYDPAEEAIVFVFLLSKSGNSMAIWRERIPIPREMKHAYERDLDDVKAGLRKEAVYVDQCVPFSDGCEDARLRDSRSVSEAAVPVVVEPARTIGSKEIPILMTEKPKKKKGFFKRLFCM